VVSAMRHSQPHALTLLVSGYPDVQSAMDTILLEADEVIVKQSKSKDFPNSSAKRCVLANLYPV
jgi:ActR/RegA family two-component response regulator